MPFLLQGIQNLSELPLDIARLIIGLAASADTSLTTALSLSLVSHEMQSCADKSLFHSIVIDHDIIPPAMVQFMDSFTSDAPSPRFVSARSYVRRITTKQEGEQDKLLKFVTLCHQLRSLALWSMPLHPEFRVTSSPYLRQLTFGKTLDDASFSFSSPLFDGVTHLELVAYSAKQWPLLWASGLTTMTTLLHLVLDATEVRTSLLPYLSDASANIPPNLRVLLLFVSGRQQRPGNHHYDERIVLATRSTAPSELPFIDLGWGTWTGETDEKETLWAKAEHVLNLRTAKNE
ncbi:hypothetical protein DL96DRAFT_567201 [Flagelloscypha sp. PMI_526]|nr:hypothetical protein DL96DRAFT_567201 [Flagelloscypha sp. PMI_526]